MQVSDVFLGHCRQSEFRVRKVDALFGPQPRTGRWDLSYLQRYALAVVTQGEAADLAVIDPNPVTGPDVLEGGRQSAVNPGGREDRPGGIPQRRAAGRGITRELQRVADLQWNGRGHAGKVTDLAGRAARAAAANAQPVSRCGVDGLLRLGDGGTADACDDRERAFATAQVADQQCVTNAQRTRTAGGDREDRADAWRRRLPLFGGRQPDACRRRQAPGRVPLRLDAHEAPDRLDAARAQLGPAQVRLNGAPPTDGLLGPPQVGRHLSPCPGVVVRAVDSHQVHPCAQQVFDQALIVGGCAGHRHHDAYRAVGRDGPQEASRVVTQQEPAGPEIDGWWRRVAGGHVRQHLQVADDRVEGRKSVRLEDAQRGEPQRVQVMLQLADVALANAQVVQEVARAVGVSRIDDIDRARMLLGKTDGLVAQVAQRRQGALDESVGSHRGKVLQRTSKRRQRM